MTVHVQSHKLREKTEFIKFPVVKNQAGKNLMQKS